MAPSQAFLHLPAFWLGAGSMMLVSSLAISLIPGCVSISYAGKSETHSKLFMTGGMYITGCQDWEAPVDHLV